MARNQSDTVTASEAMDAWRENYQNMSEAELAALTHEGRWFRNRNASAFVRVVEAPAESGPEAERAVICENMDGMKGDYQLDHFRSFITDGTLEPIPEDVIENAETIALDVAAHELGELDTLNRDSRYGVVSHTETLADASNAVQFANSRRSEAESDG